MTARLLHLLAGCTLMSATVVAQPTTRPLAPIDSLTGSIVVGVTDFAAIPDVGDAAVRNGTMYVADIGQNIVEEVSQVTPGANLGWRVWEGSFRYIGREGVDSANPRGDSTVTFPVVEYMHGDPLLLPRAAVTGLHVFRSAAVAPLNKADGMIRVLVP